MFSTAKLTLSDPESSQSPHSLGGKKRSVFQPVAIIAGICVVLILFFALVHHIHSSSVGEPTPNLPTVSQSINTAPTDSASVQPLGSDIKPDDAISPSTPSSLSVTLTSSLAKGISLRTRIIIGVLIGAVVIAALVTGIILAHGSYNQEPDILDGGEHDHVIAQEPIVEENPKILGMPTAGFIALMCFLGVVAIIAASLSLYRDRFRNRTSNLEDIPGDRTENDSNLVSELRKVVKAFEKNYKALGGLDYIPNEKDALNFGEKGLHVGIYDRNAYYPDGIVLKSEWDYTLPQLSVAFNLARYGKRGRWHFDNAPIGIYLLMCPNDPTFDVTQSGSLELWRERNVKLHYFSPDTFQLLSVELKEQCSKILAELKKIVENPPRVGSST